MHNMGRDKDYSSRYRSRDDDRSSHRMHDSIDEIQDSRPHASKRRRTSRSPPSGHDSRPSAPTAGDGHGHHHHHHSSRRHHRHRDSSSDRRSRHKKTKGGDHPSGTSVTELPFSARPLSKGDLPLFRPLFVYFLDVQKQIAEEDLDERELKGRWKSFVGKWNRGELAEGWYDPDMFERIRSSAVAVSDQRAGSGRARSEERWEESAATAREARGRTVKAGHDHGEDEEEEDEDDDDDGDYGPVLPGSAAHQGRPSGPGIPSLQDLSDRNEMLQEDREESRQELREARKADRTLQKERLDEILPRAEAGTRERQLEKRQMVNEKMRQFRDKSPGMEGDNERDLMGGGDDVEDYKKAKEREQRKKSEREIRREEFERAKREEMEEKRRAWAEREEGTVSMLRELAKQRYG